MQRKILVILLATAALSPIPVAVAQDTPPNELAAAIPRSLRYLEQGSLAWKDKMGCASCHHVAMTLWTCNEAEKRGYEVDKAAVQTFHDYLLDENNAARVVPPENPPPDRDGTQLGSIYALLALEAGSADWMDSKFTSTVQTHFLGTQRDDGSWLPFPSTGRPPIMEGIQTSARLLTLSLAKLAKATSDPVLEEAVQKGVAALAAEAPATHQAQALELMVAVETGAARETIDAQVAALLPLQRPDGSWAQTPEMAGDAYATGQTLYALGMAGMRMHDPAVVKAVQFLIETQLPDGAWPMVSRPMPGGTTGSENLEPITFAATAWAVLGLLAVS